MQIIKEFVFTLCLASLCAGVILHLFPDTAAKRCMKAIAGLYILSAMLSAMQDTRLMLIADTVIYAIENSGQDDATVSEDAFAQTLLDESELQLNAQYTAYLQEQGYDAVVDISLTQVNETVVVTSVKIALDTEMTQEEKILLTDYFSGLFETKEIMFVIEEGVS